MNSISYVSFFWAQNINSVKSLHLLQKKSLGMFFQSRNFQTGSLISDSKILKSFENTALENCIFISKSLKGLLLSVLNSWFKSSFKSHSYDARWVNFGYIKIRSYQTKKYSTYLIIVNAIFVSNYLQSCHPDFILHQLITNNLKEILITFFS